MRHAVLDGTARPNALLEDHGQSGQDHGEFQVPTVLVLDLNLILKVVKPLPYALQVS